MSFCEISITGRNRELLFKKFSKANILIHSCKNIDEKTFIVSVEQKDAKKVFAICGSTWYNKMIKQSNFSFAVELFRTRFVLVLGLVFLFVLAFVLDNRVFAVEIIGVNGGTRQQIYDKLENKVGKFTEFSTLDYSEIEKQVLEINDNFLFVTAQKHGNRLIVNVEQKKTPCLENTISEKQIKSDRVGVLRFVNAYSGTQVLPIGEKVEQGSVIIDGFFENNGEKFDCSAIGYAILECSFDYEYVGTNEFESEKALSVAKFFCVDLIEESLLREKVEIVPFGEGYTYKVKLDYLYKIGG